MGKAVAKAAKAAEWKVRAKLPGLAYFVHALEFSHDGRLLAQAGTAEAMIFADIDPASSTESIATNTYLADLRPG